MNSEILNNFGQIIQRHRKNLKISQEELAFRAGLHRTYIGMIERGEKNITLLNIHKLASALQIPVSKLFE
ncbi:helix-turn-helix domain-containing protein [Myroides injenensis]|uniref:helix-turn-helix domain-containing protein n=1 Tax=Myroides injenensis TaxID=1183151 RepID=UPI000288D472|nr:helix-turn-helix transcriptional regulator [Myroides injenensis]